MEVPEDLMEGLLLLLLGGDIIKSLLLIFTFSLLSA